MKVPKPIRKHVKRANRRMYGSDKSLRHKHITLKEVRVFLKKMTLRVMITLLIVQCVEVAVSMVVVVPPVLYVEMI